MPRIWIVNPFDPLPGDPEQAGRYASLAFMLRDAGHDVTWWTSDFSHRFKQRLDMRHLAAHGRRVSIDVRFIATPPYQRNVSLARLRSHRAFAQRFEDEARLAAHAPAVIIASNPPPDSAAAAARVARLRRAKLIIDTQDIWVENFRRLLPSVIRWSSPALLAPWVRANRFAYAAADAVVGVADIYADQAAAYNAQPPRRAVIPLGVDLAAFDRAAASGRCLLGHKPAGEIWSIYSGSMSESYDVRTVAAAARRSLPDHPHIRFIFSGRGPLEAELKNRLAGLPRVTFLGFAPFDDWAATLRQCDIGWCAIRPEALIAMPNKIFYYWAAGLAILNSIPGQCADWVRQSASGSTYMAGDPDSAATMFLNLCRAAADLTRTRAASRFAAESTWDRRLLYDPYVRLVNDLCNQGPASA